VVLAVLVAVAEAVMKLKMVFLVQQIPVVVVAEQVTISQDRIRLVMVEVVLFLLHIFQQFKKPLVEIQFINLVIIGSMFLLEVELLTLIDQLI
jgi:hypothetical protein